MVSGCVRIIDVSVIDTIHIVTKIAKQIRDGFTLRSVQYRGKTLF